MRLHFSRVVIFRHSTTPLRKDTLKYNKNKITINNKNKIKINNKNKINKNKKVHTTAIQSAYLCTDQTMTQYFHMPTTTCSKKLKKKIKVLIKIRVKACHFTAAGGLGSRLYFVKAEV